MTRLQISGSGATAALRKNEAALHMDCVPAFSVVVPFYSYDVRPLALRLEELARTVDQPLSIVFLDDGSPDSRWADNLWEITRSLRTPFTVGVLSKNVGRAQIRNHLCHMTDAAYLLYLDADMWPDNDDFLSRYLNWLAEGGVDVIYGGRSADKVVLTGPEYVLHKTFTRLREQIAAEIRRKSPAYSFYSCNFLVRKEILAEIPLNAGYTGWGWEDCEWAMRVAQRYQIRHEDNPASHLGLLTAKQILSKYDESVGNFSQFFDRYPEVVSTTMLVRVAKLIGTMGVGSPAKAIASTMALAPWLPMRLQLAGLMLYKAALYAPLVAGRSSNN